MMRRWPGIVCGGWSRCAGPTPRSAPPAPESTTASRPNPASRRRERAVWFEKAVCLLDRVSGVDHVPASAEELASEWYESDVATGCALLMSRQEVERTGGFDEGFFAYFEDVDLSLRLRSTGLKCAVIPGALAWHKVSQSTRNEKSPSTWYYLFRNGHYLIQRHADPKSDLATYRRNGLFQTLRQIGTMVEYNSFPAGVSSLQGLVGAWRGQTGIRPARRPGLGLKAATHVIYRSYRLRNRLKRIFARG